VSRIEAWQCPKCGRMVPKRVTVCRCGHQSRGNEQAGTVGVDSAAVSTAMSEPSSAQPRRPWSAVGLVVLVVAGAAVAFQWRRPQSSAAATPAPVESAIETAPGDASHAASSKRWPTDPGLWKDPASGTSPAISPQARSTSAVTALSLEDVVSAAIPAVVLVQTTDARGTGFYVSNDTVITNAHVVDGATYVTLRSASGDETPAIVTVRSNEMDLAELHVARTRPGQAVLPLSDSSHVRVGEEIVAIGSPMGLQNTVTRGIVSSLRRLGAVMLVQTDAAINHGNSGGPLVDHSGRVIAVATMKMTGDVQAIGFGVAAEHVRALLDGNLTGSSSDRRPVDVLNSGNDADTERDDAVAGYERIIADVAKRADQLDRSWADLRAQCMSGPAPKVRGEREWFVLWEAFDGNSVAQACGNYFADFSSAVRTFQQRMSEAADAARRSGVFPGEARDIRHRYHVDSPDW
jgi:putative serine protease PepD